MTSDVAAPARSARALGAACLGLAGAAGLVGGASALTWYTVTPAGRAPVAFSGAQASPSLTGFALVALAGVAALVATGGVVRRVLAGLLALAGAAVAWTAAVALTRTAATVTGAPASLPRPATSPPPTLDVTPAPALAVAGGLLLLGVGVLVLLREPRLSRLGARYAAPGARPVEVDPDRAAWQDLDAGRDPTVDPAPDPAREEGDDPVEGVGHRPG